MKLKILIALVGIVMLAGCKPKQITLSGQVFIVTQGAESIKLGDVEVLLIEKSQATNYLLEKQAVISNARKLETQTKLEAHQRAVDNAESEMETRQSNVTGEGQKVEDTQKEFDQVQEKYEQFMANQPFLTNAVYVTIKKNLDSLMQESVEEKRQIDDISEDIDRSVPIPAKTRIVGNGEILVEDGPERARQQAMKIQEIHLQYYETNLPTINKQIGFDEQALEKIRREASGFQEDKLSEPKSLLEAAKLRLAKAQTSLASAKSNLETIKNTLPIEPEPVTADDYFDNFSPTFIKKMTTDPDGKFTISYSRNKAFTLFAKASRATVGDTEKYYWLVNAPANGETAQILLSNNNLIEADPDGYLTLKPQQAKSNK